MQSLWQYFLSLVFSLIFIHTDHSDTEHRSNSTPFGSFKAHSDFIFALDEARVDGILDINKALGVTSDYFLMADLPVIHKYVERGPYAPLSGIVGHNKSHGKGWLHRQIKR